MSQNIEGQTITTRAPKAVEKGVKPAEWSITLADPFLGDLQDLLTKFGDEAVVEAARAQLRIKFQSAVRSLAEAGREDNEISTIMSAWKPGTPLNTGGDPVANVMKNYGNMSAEQRAQLKALLQQMQD